MTKNSRAGIKTQVYSSESTLPIRSRPLEPPAAPDQAQSSNHSESTTLNSFGKRPQSESSPSTAKQSEPTTITHGVYLLPPGTTKNSVKAEIWKIVTDSIRETGNTSFANEIFEAIKRRKVQELEPKLE